MFPGRNSLPEIKCFLRHDVSRTVMTQQYFSMGGAYLGSLGGEATAGLHSLHNAADGVILHLDQQVKMIGHEAICVEKEGKLGFLLSKSIREPAIVIV